MNRPTSRATATVHKHLNFFFIDSPFSHRACAHRSLIKNMNQDSEQKLERIYREIDNKEELQLEASNPRHLSARDNDDIRTMANGTSNLYDLFAYANRPKREVLQYMQEHHPRLLEMLLDKTQL